MAAYPNRILTDEAPGRLLVLQPADGTTPLDVLVGTNVPQITQPDFYVTTTGNDNADGATLNTALRTNDELTRRLDGGRLAQTTTVHYGSGSFGAFNARVFAAAGINLFVEGTVSQGATQTLSAVTNQNPAANVRAAIGVASGGAFARGQRLKLTSGAQSGKWGYVTRAIDANNANVNGWSSDGFTQVNAPNGSNFVVETLSTVMGPIMCHVYGGGNARFRDLDLTPPGSAQHWVLGQAIGNLSGDVVFERCYSEGTSRFANSNFALSNCNMRLVNITDSTLTTSGSVYRVGLSLNTRSEVITAGPNCCLVGQTSNFGALTLPTSAVVSTSHAWEFSDISQQCALNTNGRMRLRTGGLFWGTNNVITTATFIVQAGGVIVYTGGNTPIIAGGAVDVQIAGVNVAYAGLPLVPANTLTGMIVGVG